MPPTTDELATQIKEIKDLLSDISKTIAEMQKRPCQLPSCRVSRPVETVPQTYSIMLDVAAIEDGLCAVGTVHLLPHRGKSDAKQVTHSSIHTTSQMEALLASIGSSLKTVMTYCPEKLVIYTKSKKIERIVKEGKAVLKGETEGTQRLAQLLATDLSGLRNMFPIEVKRGIPEGHENEIKSLIAQAELEYIRQKEKLNGTKGNRNSESLR